MSALNALGVNGSLYAALTLQAQDALIFLRDAFQSCVDSAPSLVPASLDFEAGPLTERLIDALYFSETELLLLKTFIVILVLTLLLILLSWRVYGKRISERFMRPATSATIEQLKESVSKLKLPKEHTPRI